MTGEPVRSAPSPPSPAGTVRWTKSPHRSTTRSASASRSWTSRSVRLPDRHASMRRVSTSCRRARPGAGDGSRRPQCRGRRHVTGPPSSTNRASKGHGDRFDAVEHRPPLDPHRTVGGGVPDGVHHQVRDYAGQRGRVGRTSTPFSTAPSRRTRRVRATGSAPVSASLTTSRSPTGCRVTGSRRRGSGTARTGRRPSAPSGRPPRASARGSAPAPRPGRPRGPRSSRAGRPAACAGRGTPRRPARDGTPRGGSRGPGTRPAARWCGSARRTGRRTRRAATPGLEPPALAEAPGVLLQRRRPPYDGRADQHREDRPRRPRRRGGP